MTTKLRCTNTGLFHLAGLAHFLMVCGVPATVLAAVKSQLSKFTPTAITLEAREMLPDDPDRLHRYAGRDAPMMVHIRDFTKLVAFIARVTMALDEHARAELEEPQARNTPEMAMALLGFQFHARLVQPVHQTTFHQDLQASLATFNRTKDSNALRVARKVDNLADTIREAEAYRREIESLKSRVALVERENESLRNCAIEWKRAAQNAEAGQAEQKEQVMMAVIKELLAEKAERPKKRSSEVKVKEEKQTWTQNKQART